MRLQVPRHGQRVLADAVHAQRQRLHALRICQALKGEMAAPMLRNGTTRAPM